MLFYEISNSTGMINKMSFKTNIHDDEIMNGLKSAFQADRRIWAMGWEKGANGYITVTVEAEFDSEEMIAKFNSVGYQASLLS